MNFAVVVPCWTHNEISRHSPAVGRRPYNLYCVGTDVKPCSINPAVGVVSQKWHDKAGPWGQTKPSTKGYRGGSPTAVHA